VPRCLPAEFHHHVKVYQLIDTEFPGYVTVELICKLIKCNNDDYYECFPTESCYASITLPHDPHHDTDLLQQTLNASPQHARTSSVISDSSWLSVDAVLCIRCLVWPPQAADWPTRRRKHGWPDLTTVERIVNNGCDVVQISHPQCRQDEWMREHQWRLSFSRAETVLLNTWSVKQQLVYHIFRIFIKMLWTCESLLTNEWNSL
jgi:hypothetical protein